jgi:hypothetical protein
VTFDGVAPGHYELSTGNPPRLIDFEATASAAVDASAGAATAPVSGTLESAGGTAPENLFLVLMPVNAGGRHAALQTVARKGVFLFPAVPQSEWELTAQSGGVPYPAVAVAEGGASHAGGAVRLGGRPLRLRVTLAAGTTRIVGMARKGGKGKAGAMVVLAPREPGALHSLARRDQSDSNGSFALRDVPPGEYTVVAMEDGWELDWGLPGALDRYLSHGVPVRVTAASGKQLRLESPVEVQPR